MVILIFFLDLIEWNYQCKRTDSYRGQCDVKYIMTLPIKTIMSVLKISTYFITRSTTRSIRFDTILVIMSISTFKANNILYIVTLTFPQITSKYICFWSELNTNLRHLILTCCSLIYSYYSTSCQALWKVSNWCQSNIINYPPIITFAVQ